MTLLSVRAKEATKTSLAIVIAYGISLSMGWDKPVWAGFTVAFISLPTIGQSLRKGILRMLGTLMAGAVALTLIALFAQERWWFMVALSLYIGFCTYRMLGSKNPYFYFVAAFVCAIICLDGGVESLSAFQTAVDRIQETGMGILVYTLISVLLWPQSTRGALDDTSRKLVAVQSQLFQAHRELVAGKGTAKDPTQLRMQHAQLIAQFGQVLDGAEADSYEVWEARHQWRHLKQLSSKLGEALERWRTTLTEIEQLNLEKLLPNLETVCAELDTRLAQIEPMLIGRTFESNPRPARLAMDESEVHELSHFQQAALATTRAQLEDIDTLSRALLECVAGIKGRSLEASTSPGTETVRKEFSFDLDRFEAAVRVVAGVWLGFLIWIYFDPPASPIFLIFLIAVSVAMAQMPWVSGWKLFVPLAVSAVFAGVIYIFVMPRISTYAELGLLFFVVTFAIGYAFAEQRLALLRIIGLALFLFLTSVENQQSYSFTGYANQVTAIFMAILVLVAAAHVPTSPRPEKAFLRLLNRYFRHAEILMSRLAVDREQERGWVGRWEMALYKNDLLELPQKLAVWGKQIDHRTFPENSPEQVQALVNSLDVLAHRIKILMDAREATQAGFLVRELLQDVRAWRIAAQGMFGAYGNDLAAGSRTDLQEIMTAKLKRMEDRINATFNHAEKEVLSVQDYENFYRLLGAFRLLSEALIAHGRVSADVNWAHWKEARL